MIGPREGEWVAVRLAEAAIGAAFFFVIGVCVATFALVALLS